jgi:hypothetical protein
MLHALNGTAKFVPTYKAGLPAGEYCLIASDRGDMWLVTPVELCRYSAMRSNHQGGESL